MAPVELSSRVSNTLPLIYLGGVSLLASACLFTIIRSFVKIRTALPVSQRTRAHRTKRRNDVILFAVLAAISLAVQSYNLIETLVDSYGNYVVANRVSTDVDPWTSILWYPREDSFEKLQLRSWWASGELEKSLIAFGTSARDYWWFQQLQVSTVLWATFLGIEGHRRNIPRLWAFIPLVTLFGLAFAQNLFFIALLLTPVPYKPAYKRSSSRPKGRVSAWLKRLHLTPSTDRPVTWTPDAEVHLMPLVLSMICIASLPYINDHLYTQLVAVDRQILWFIPLLLSHTNLLPSWLGTAHPTVHAAHASSKAVFRTGALLALALHAFSTYSAIATNTAPGASKLRFHLFPQYEDESTRSAIARYGHGVGKVLGAFTDSPLVQLVVWDVILSGLSLCAWAATRGLHPGAVLSVFGFPAPADLEPSSKTVSRATKDRPLTPKAKSYAAAAKAALVGTPKTTGSSTRGRPSKRNEAQQPDDESADDRDYRPTSAVAAAERGVEHDEHREPVDFPEAAESGAVVWGVLVATGLGGGMAGVCGGELS